jgi:ABC-type sugar transport system ATPase subunit
MLELKNISIDLGEFSLRNISFTVDEGQYFVLLGRSGAGKSILLEIIAGLIKPDGGKVILNGKDITAEPMQKRNVGIVFQDYAIFPHLSVRENICYPLKANKTPKNERGRIVRELSERMGISGLLDRMPGSLSGGELQRVALARTLTLRPKVLLLDEPLSSLDSGLRYKMRNMLRNLNGEGLTMIHVTHDYDTTVALAQKVAIINKGKILQTGTLKDVFHNPGSRFVANLTGIHNFYRARLKAHNKAMLEEKLEITVLPVGEEENKGFVFFRSDDVVVSLEKIESSMTNSVRGVITGMVPAVNGMEVIVDAGIRISAHITNESTEKLGLAEGKRVWVSFKAVAVRFIGR